MVSNAFDKMLTGTEWGALDVLLVDMPPGVFVWVTIWIFRLLRFREGCVLVIDNTECRVRSCSEQIPLAIPTGVNSLADILGVVMYVSEQAYLAGAFDPRQHVW